MMGTFSTRQCGTASQSHRGFMERRFVALHGFAWLSMAVHGCVVWHSLPAKGTHWLLRLTRLTRLARLAGAHRPCALVLPAWKQKQKGRCFSVCHHAVFEDPK